MKIVALEAENVKKLRAVEIRPDGNLVQITGKNGQGKTSVLDSIWWALAGASHIQAAPIRKGADKARIRLDLGEIKVTRTFGRGTAEKPATTSIVVESAEGARFPSPQKMLDGLLGELSFDPLAFTRMDAGQQFDVLKRFVPDVDFEGIEAANRDDYALRTDINRQAKERRAAAGPALPPDTPTERRDEAALVAELERAGQHNAEHEKRSAARKAATERVATDRAATERLEALIPERVADIEGRCNRRIAEINAEIDRLNAQMNEVAAQGAIDGKAARDTLTDQARAHRTNADALQQKLDAAKALPEPIDTAALREQITSARDHNELVDRAQRSLKLTAEAEALEAQSKALTEAMEARKADKLAKISAATLPVESIEFGDGAILMNGVPFDQASDAEQLRASVAIAMAANPKLRVIRVRDGSLLDEDAMTLLAEMAEAADYQVWVERVDGSGRVGFVLEDGALKSTPQAEEAA